MPTNKQLAAMTQEQHAAWLDEMTEDERLVVNVPVGYRYTLVIVSHVKRALVSCKMSVGLRLRMLELLNANVDLYFTEAALAAIEPACDTAIEMIYECMKVDEGNLRLGKGFDLLASHEVFGHLLSLNPSLLDAIKLCGGNTPRAAAPPKSENIFYRRGHARPCAATETGNRLANARGIANLVHMSTRANKHKLTHTVAARVEPELYREIESLADQERRPPGSLVRNILADWFKSRQQEEAA